MADWLEAQFLLNVFMDLNTTRPPGMMGLLLIPWTAVMWYADRLGLDHEAAQNLWLLIRDVDQRYVQEANKKAEARNNTNTPGAGNRKAIPQRTRGSR